MNRLDQSFFKIINILLALVLCYVHKTKSVMFAMIFLREKQIELSSINQLSKGFNAYSCNVLSANKY